MSKAITMVWLAAVVTVALAVVGPAGAQSVSDPYVQAYRSGAATPAPRALTPQQRRSQANQPARNGRQGDGAYSYEGNPSTTGRAYEVPGGATGHGNNNPAGPPQGGRPLPSYQQPGNYQNHGYGNPSTPPPGGRVSHPNLPDNYGGRQYGNPSAPPPGGRVSHPNLPDNYGGRQYGNPSMPPSGGRPWQPERPYNYEPEDDCGGGSWSQSGDPRWGVQGVGNAFYKLGLMGCDVVAADGTFLGRVSRDRNDPQALGNVNGAYGNPYSPLSIFNPQGRYGSTESPLSVWSTSTRTPPAYYAQGQFRCYLTSNRAFTPRVGPVALADEMGLQLR